MQKKGQDVTLKHRARAVAPAPPMAFSRSELAYTLSVNRCVTNATLVVCWGICLILACGFAAGVYGMLTSGAPARSPSLSVVGIIAACAVAFVGSVHYLWRCYRTGQSDVRKLLRQMSRLDVVDQEFVSGRRQPAPKRRTDAADASQDVERQRDVRSSTPAATLNSDNVVPFDPNRRLIPKAP
jgi:hypothetical protein